MKKLLDKLESALAAVLAALMGALVLDVTWQVVSRFVLNNPSSYTEEVALFLMLWVALLGAAYAFRRGAHLGLDIVVAKLEGNRKVIAQKLAEIISLAFACIILIYGGLKLVLLNYELKQTSAALEVEVWIIYSVIPLSGLLIAIFAIERIIFGAPELNAHEKPE